MFIQFSLDINTNNNEQKTDKSFPEALFTVIDSLISYKESQYDVIIVINKLKNRGNSSNKLNSKFNNYLWNNLTKIAKFNCIPVTFTVYQQRKCVSYFFAENSVDKDKSAYKFIYLIFYQ